MASGVGSGCNVVLYYQDKRISDSEWSDKTEVSFDKDTAVDANKTICDYFKVTDTCDKKLFQSALETDPDFNWFEFTRKLTPDVTCGIRLSDDSDRNVLFITKEASSPEALLDKGTRKIHVSVKSVFGSREYDLNVEDIRSKRRSDRGVVALYNATSFFKLVQCSTNMGVARTLEVVDAAEGSGESEDTA